MKKVLCCLDEDPIDTVVGTIVPLDRIISGISHHDPVVILATRIVLEYISAGEPCTDPIFIIFT